MLRNFRQYSWIDQLIIQWQHGCHTLFEQRPRIHRDTPAALVCEGELTSREKQRSIAYMRVNHSGEVCAQALYRGQAVLTTSPHVKEMLHQAASEETDHLAWCAERIEELGGKCSVFNPFWYWKSFVLGVFVGWFGDASNLGFVQETETQVEVHLKKHLDLLPLADHKSRAIVEQMCLDEKKHGAMAAASGAAPLPFVVRILMALQAKVMTTLSHWL